MPSDLSAVHPRLRGAFGRDFVWGVATVAYQIEGTVNEDEYQGYGDIFY